MPFVTPSVRRRILITGETGVGKTHAFRTFPGPRYVMLFPGEKGQDTLLKPTGEPLDADTKVCVWEHPAERPLTSTQVIEEVRRQTIRVLKGDEGPMVTFCGDGLHKLYEYVMDALSGGEFFAGSPFKTETQQDKQVVDPRIASQAEHWLADYISLLSLSKLPYVVMTTWDTDKGIRRAKTQVDGKKEKWTDIPTVKMPALYAAASRRVLGEFGYCLHASATWKRVEVAPGKYERQRLYRWQTVADDEVGACAIKGDAAITSKIPKFVPADWRELAKFVEAQ